MAFKFTYKDGRTQTVTCDPFDGFSTEKKCREEGWDFNGYTSNLYMAYNHLRRDRQIAEPFETWLKRLVRIEAVEDETQGEADAPDGPKGD